ncbi:hypothetical protein [Kitasatospora cineracea]|uniref:Uncharacterized protein n=1 Tax=Kitasatospora cineracea TaxID=88074 RepID=A0A3N4R1U7_9ACTN|nr:hypothetical protein [Kitasatospora cineracea]RPE27298.1 hypothetical protein EDD38_7443 [Kitasatospora cineracea]
MNQHNPHLLPDGRPLVAEGHDLTAAGLQALADGYAENTAHNVWTWTFVNDDESPW